MHEMEMKLLELNSHLYHFFTVMSMYLTILIFTYLSAHYHPNPSSCLSPFYAYGPNITRILFISRYAILLPLPLAVANFMGILLFNTSPVASLSSPAADSPLVKFRFVTVGKCKETIKQLLQRNIRVCESVGFKNYIFEVVTNKVFNLGKSINIKEVFIPETYRTYYDSSGKARLLQYCLENDKESKYDWVVNLTDDTLLTDTAVIGILNFINKGDHQIGQGTVCYDRQMYDNWKTKFADLIRVGYDYGMLRLSLNIFEKPVFGWKDNFVVVSTKAEEEVTYDFGPDGSIAEQYTFAMNGWSKGLKFGFVEGEVREKRQTSSNALISQRTKWIHGFILTLINNSVAIDCKIATLISLLGTMALPLGTLSVVLGPIYPIEVPIVFRGVCGFIGGVMAYLYIFGAMKIFSRKRHNNLKRIVLCLLPVVYLPVTVCFEIWSTLMALVSLRTILVSRIFRKGSFVRIV